MLKDNKTVVLDFLKQILPDDNIRNEFLNKLKLCILKRLSNTSSEKVNEKILLDESNLLVKQFKNLNITIYGTYEEPLFKAKDIGELLDIKNIRDTINEFDEQLIKAPVGNTDRCVEQIFLTEDGLYEVIFTSRKQIAKDFKKWVRSVIKEIRLKGKYDLEEQLKIKDQESKQKELDYQLQLKLKDQELQLLKEKTYEEIDKPGHVYILKCDGGYKVGKTKDSVSKRIKGLQTGNVNNIEIIMDCETCNEDLLEKNVHYILDRYRSNSNREFFDCNVEYIKMIIELVNNNLNTMKSTYQTITKDELYNRYTNKLELIKEKYDIEEYDKYIFDETINNQLIKNSIIEEQKENDPISDFITRKLVYDPLENIKLTEVINLYIKENKLHINTKTRGKIIDLFKKKLTIVNKQNILWIVGHSLTFD